MSTYNICFYWEIRKISAFFGSKKRLSVAMLTWRPYILCEYVKQHEGNLQIEEVLKKSAPILSHWACPWGTPQAAIRKMKSVTAVTSNLFIQNCAGLGGSVGCSVWLETRRSRVQPPPRSATFFHGDWSWNIFYGHSLPSADSRRAVVSFWRKNVHNTG